MIHRFTIRPVGPYDFGLSLRVAASFAPDLAADAQSLRVPVRLAGTPRLLTLRQTAKHPPVIEGVTEVKSEIGEATAVARRVISAETDLKPFYRAVKSHRVLGAITRELRGLKPCRPASLFDMFVVAITEQQISLAAAYRIRTRVLDCFGELVAGMRLFPAAATLAEAPLAALRSCGLSHAKAEYIRDLARNVAAGELDLNALEAMPDADAYQLLIAQRGIGPWAAEYILVRGLGRVDRVPSIDLGIRRVVASYLGRGLRLSPLGVERKLAPFEPYRGLAAFYLLAHNRLPRRQATETTTLS